MEKAFKCNLCSKEYYSRYNLNVHVSQHAGISYSEKKFKCNVCDCAFSKQNVLISHMRSHTGERPFKCTVIHCGKAFTEETNLNRHIKFKHSDERPFKCDFPGCRHTTKSTETLNRHMAVHSDDRPFPCPNVSCDYRAKYKCDIWRHMKSVHSDAQFACSECDYKTAQKYLLMSHMRRRHFHKDFKCSHPQCTAAFGSSYDLKVHFRRLHGDKNFECDHPGCDRQCASANELKSHKFQVHSKTFVCPSPNCSYRTNTEGKLGHHMIKHDGGNKKIPCSIKDCVYKGKNSRAMALHLRCQGTLFKCPVPGCGIYSRTKDALRNHTKFHDPLGRPFQCPLCYKRYPTRPRLQAHSLSHTKEKLFRCGHCEFGTYDRTTMKGHISSVHANLKFPFIILPFDHRQCLQCKVTLPLSEFTSHIVGHMVPVVMVQRLEVRWA